MFWKGGAAVKKGMLPSPETVYLLGIPLAHVYHESKVGQLWGGGVCNRQEMGKTLSLSQSMPPQLFGICLVKTHIPRSRSKRFV